MPPRTSGFTLLELLVAMLIIGILAVLAQLTLVSSIRNASNTRFAESLAQDINFARSLAMARGDRTQITFTSLNSYSVVNLDVAGMPTLRTQTNLNVTLGGVTVGDKIICASGGFCLAYNSAGAVKTISSVTATANNRTTTLSITVLGFTRTES